MNESLEEVVIEKKKPQERLASLGFTNAASRLQKIASKKRQMAVAYEHYRFVTMEKIHAFNHKLFNERNDLGGYKTLSFTPVSEYQEFPPEYVLASLETAIERKCFDSFEVAHIVQVKDPILFGRIDECSDRFFIDQWDEDVKIEDILKENEG